MNRLAADLPRKHEHSDGQHHVIMHRQQVSHQKQANVHENTSGQSKSDDSKTVYVMRDMGIHVCVCSVLCVFSVRESALCECVCACVACACVSE